jgi:hypothetical protein
VHSKNAAYGILASLKQRKQQYFIIPKLPAAKISDAAKAQILG